MCSVGRSDVLQSSNAMLFLPADSHSKTKQISKANNMSSKAPIRVLITGAAGQIGYSLIPLVAGGSIFGADQPVILHLLDIPPAQKALDGVVMEIEDCAYPLLRGLVATVTLEGLALFLHLVYAHL